MYPIFQNFYWLMMTKGMTHAKSIEIKCVKWQNSHTRNSDYLESNRCFCYRIFLFLRYEYIRKNPTTAPITMPAVVSQNANCKSETISVSWHGPRKKHLKMSRGFRIRLEQEWYHVFFKIRSQVHAKYTCKRVTI